MRGDFEKFDNYYFMTFLDKSSSNVETSFYKMKHDFSSTKSEVSTRATQK